LNYLKAIIVYLVIVFILHVIPTSAGDGEGLGLSSRMIFFVRADYLLHFLIFIPLMVLVWLYLNQENITGTARVNHALLWLVGGICFAFLMEGLHLLLPYRTFNPVDFFLNAAGVIMGAVVFLWDPVKFAVLK